MSNTFAVSPVAQNAVAAAPALAFGDKYVSFAIGKKTAHVTLEAAVVRGGRNAMAQVHDHAIESAFEKARNGRYAAAANVLEMCFPKKHKAYVEFVGGSPSANKATMAAYLQGMNQATPAAKSGEWSKREMLGRELLGKLNSLPAFKSEGEVVAQS